MSGHLGDDLTELEFLRAGLREAIAEGAQLIAAAIEGKRPATEGENKFWFEFVSLGLCGLCGQHGVIDTRDKMFSPAGVECGVLAYCICPNGRTLKTNKVNLEELVHVAAGKGWKR